MKTEYVNCNLCGADNYEVIWDKAQREQDGTLQGLSIRDEQGKILHPQIVMCKECGLVYTNPRMTAESLKHFYTVGYREIYNDEGVDSECEKQHARNAFELLSPYMTKGERFLDVGCSTGELVSLMLGVGLAYGIEPNEEYCEVAQWKGLIVGNYALEDFKSPYKFDTITMLNTLEHLADPSEALQKLRSLLTDDGYLLLSVPNLTNRSILRAVDTFLSDAHIYQFEQKTLTMLLQKNGFVVENVAYLDESIGEKLYLLCRKADITLQLEAPPEGYCEKMKTFLHNAQRVWEVKVHITDMGFK